MSFEPASANGIRRELEQAEMSLNHHIAERNRQNDEITRWQSICDGLRQMIDLLESPAIAARKTDARGGGSVPRKRIRWEKEWSGVLGGLAAINVYPTKRELMVEIRAKYQIPEGTAAQAVYKAVRDGSIIVKLDRCYLRGKEFAA